MLPSTVDRVPQQTTESANHRIRLNTESNIARVARAGTEAIELRLRELDNEWDIERTLEANASTVALLGLVLGATVDRRWFLLPAVVAGFLLQHSLQGWCPPLELFRRGGVRTATEIDHERYALKAIRGDFEQVSRRVNANPASLARQAFEAAHNQLGH